MAFNKAKSVDAAEKYLAQGKIGQAIEQYQNIFKHDPRDLSLLNTIGDLFIRLGQTSDAISHFHRLAEAYVSEGFLMRGIAIYKKMAKLDASQVAILEKLAELYAVQGLMSEARSHFLQLAEYYIKSNQVDKAVGIFRKMLAQEPDNATVQMRLAELCERIGKTSDAVEAYLRAAERLAQKQDHKESLRLADKILGLDGNHVRARVVKARSLVATGQASSAISLLEPLAETDDSCAMLLVESYLSGGQLPQARAWGERIFDSKPDRYELLFAIACHHEESGDAGQALELLGRISSAMIEHDETEKLVSRVESLAEREDVAIAALELLKKIFEQTGEHFRVPDILDRIADAWGKRNEHAKAREILEELVRLEPDNPHHVGRLNQLLILMGDRPHPVTPPAQPAGMEEESFTLADQRPAEGQGVESKAEDELDAGTLKRLTSALTDADLMSSYGRPQKAIEILQSALELVPNHPAALEKLLDLYLGAGDWPRVAEYADKLSGIYAERGATRQAERFLELANRYHKQPAAPPSEPLIGLPEAELAPMVEEEVAEPARPEGTGSRPDESEVALIEAQPGQDGAEALHEIDLSEEWEKIVGTTGMPPPGSPGLNTAEVCEEVEFYIREGLVDEALAVIDKLAEQFPRERMLSELREKALAAKASGAVESPEETLITRLEPEETAILFDFEDIASGTVELQQAGTARAEPPAAPPPPKTMPEAIGPRVSALAAQEAEQAEAAEAPTSPRPVAEEITATEFRQVGTPEPVFADSVAAEPVPAETEAPAVKKSKAAEPFMTEPGAEAPEEPEWTPPEPGLVGATESAPAEPEPEPTEEEPVEVAAALPFEESGLAPSLEAAEESSEEPRTAGEVETLELVLEASPATGPVASVPTAAEYDGNQFLADLAAEFEILPESAEPPTTPQSGTVELSAATGVEQLSEVLEEFRHELGETDEVEDAETHYNLGIAYKEMGLLEEAISEFQKAFKNINRGQSGASRMECCVQLAVCFMDKAMPQIAIKWYLKGLESPGLEPESVLALRYDLGVAYELSGDMNRALESYQEVYAMNIDYRDVADRISALSRPRA